MLKKSLVALLSCGLLIGCSTPNSCGTPGALCAPTGSMTSKPGPAASPAPVVNRVVPGNTQTSQTFRVTAAGQTEPLSAQDSKPAAPHGPARIALLLPLGSAGLGGAAKAIRSGFMAAHTREQNGVAVSVIESGETTDEILASYSGALGQNELVVGPLSRSGVAAVAQSGLVSKPTIALNHPDPGAGGEIVLPPKMLVIGLSVEDEARQIALWAATQKEARKAFIVSTGIAWQRRAAKGFAQQWEALGRESKSLELNEFAGYLNTSGLEQLRAHVANEKPALLFVALDAEQTSQLRSVVGNEIAVYGTSQLNPLTLSERNGATRMADLNGVRLLDLPWQLQADHAAVMIYPRPLVAADEKRNVDHERLYALGIDAYRIAREMALKQASFELDGVTGKLSIRLSATAARFERIEQQAIYLDGAASALEQGR